MEELVRAEQTSIEAAATISRARTSSPLTDACVDLWLDFLREQTAHSCDQFALVERALKEGDLETIYTAFSDEPRLDTCGLRGTKKRRQQEALEAILAKMAKANVDEVGMGRDELAEISTMPSGSARNALDSIVAQGWLERRKMPRLSMNKQARRRRRARGRESQYFYSLPEAVREGIRERQPKALREALGQALSEAFR